MDQSPENNLPHRKRLKRNDESGEARFLTFSCFKRQPFLTRQRSCQWVIDGIERARDRHCVHVWAFVIMPEHVHLLVYPTSSVVDISAFLYTLKKSVTNRALNFVRAQNTSFLERMRDRQPDGTASYRFWQRGGGYDENLLRPRKIWEKIDYIHNNPVIRGLCGSPTDWEWTSAKAFETKCAEPLRIDWDSLPVDPRDRLRA